MIWLQVFLDAKAQRQYAVFGNEPFRVHIDVIARGHPPDAPAVITHVYAGTKAREETPDWHPCCCFLSDNDTNRSHAALTADEVTKMKKMVTRNVAQLFRDCGMEQQQTFTLAQLVQGSEEDKYFDPDSRRYVYPVE